MQVTPFRARDYLEAWALTRIGVPRRTDPIDREWAARTYEKGGPAFTARLDGQILACAGLMVLWPGVASAWALISPLGAKGHGLALHWGVKRELEALIRLRCLWRVEADVEASNRLAIRWIRLLGFHEEGIRVRRGPLGEDLAHYARLQAIHHTQEMKG